MASAEMFGASIFGMVSRLPKVYDEPAAAMIAQMKYGNGMPFHRLERLEQNLGIPLPAATQWEIVEEAAELIRPAHAELICQAAQGEVLHNDDTSMRVLHLAREPADERTGDTATSVSGALRLHICILTSAPAL
jgi:Transposase IS66 family